MGGQKREDYQTTCEEHTIALALAQKPHQQTAGVPWDFAGPHGDLQPLLNSGSPPVHLCARQSSGGVRVGTSAGFFALIAGWFTCSSWDCISIYQVSILRGRLLKSHYPPVSESRGRGLMFPEVFPGSQKSTLLLQLMVGNRDSVSLGNVIGPTGLINSVILDR